MARNYSYTARDAAGRLLQGTILAENEAAVAAHVREKGYFVTRIAPAEATLFDIDLRNLIQRVKISELAVFCRLFSTLTNAGVSLLASLNVLIDQTSNPRLKTAVRDIYLKVQAGETLSRAMAGHPRVFPEIMISMVEAGEVGGVLDNVLERLAIQFEKEHKINEKVRSAMTYPIVVLCMAALVVTFILTFVLPTFVKMFAGMNLQLPLLTRMLMAVSEFLRKYALILLPAAGGMVYGLGVLLRQPKVRMAVDPVMLKLPIFGNLIRKIAIARFTRTLGTLLRGGVPIIDALEVVKKTTANMAMLKSLTAAQASVRGGRGLAGPLAGSGMFPPMVVQMVAVGEETGEIDTMLEKVAEFYESDVDDLVSRLSSLLEPVLIGILGIIVGVIIVAVMLPLFDMITGMNNLLR